jgi:hypothetical protein
MNERQTQKWPTHVEARHFIRASASKDDVFEESTPTPGQLVQ